MANVETLEEKRLAFEALYRILQRENHILTSDPDALSSHLHNRLYLDEGKDGPAGFLLARANEALADRPWLRLINRPSVERSALVRLLEHGGMTHAWSPDNHILATTGAIDALRQNYVHIWDAETGLLRVTLEHEGFARTPAWSPDGKILVSGDENSIRLWNPATGSCLRTLKGHTSAVSVLAWSPDGKLLASGSWDCTVRLWDTYSWRLQAILRGHTDRVAKVVWSPDGRLLASATEARTGPSKDKTARVWDAAAAKERVILPEHKLDVSALAWSPDGRFLASLSSDGTLWLWDATSGKASAAPEVEGSWQKHLAWSPDGFLLASWGGSGTGRLWCPATGEMWAHLNGSGNKYMTALAWCPDTQTLAGGFHNGAVLVWHRNGGDPIAVLQGHRNEISKLSWSPNGRTLASTGGGTRLWDLSLVKEKDSGEQDGHADKVVALAWSPDGETLASLGGVNDKTIRLWGAETAAERAHIRVSSVTSVPLKLGWSPDSALLSCAESDGRIYMWDANGVAQHVIEGQGRRVDIPVLAWSPNGNVLAFAGGLHDYTVRLWNRERDKVQVMQGEHSNRIHVLAWSPNGTVLASGSHDKTIRLWKTVDGTCLAVLKGHSAGVSCLAWSPQEDTILASADDWTVRLWNTTTAQPGPSLENQVSGNSVNSLAWSPDGSLLASGTSYGRIRVWEYKTGKLTMMLEGHKTDVDVLAWSPDSRFIASACGGYGPGSRVEMDEDFTVRLWHVPTGRCLLVAHCLSPVRGLQFSQDGHILQAADDGGATGNRPIPYLFELCNIDIGAPVLPAAVVGGRKRSNEDKGTKPKRSWSEQSVSKEKKTENVKSPEKKEQVTESRRTPKGKKWWQLWR